MLWLGIKGRVKLQALEERCERLERQFRDLDGEVTGHLDRLEGIAKRFTGRKGGRPPAEPQEADLYPELAHVDPISREIILRRRGRGNGA